MGRSGSKPVPPPPPPPEFDKEWRKMQWENKNEIEQNLRDFKINHTDVKFVRLLLVGQVGAGKSSFINSVNNVFQKRITSVALTNATIGSSFTKFYETYEIKGKDGSTLPFVFNDVMGLEKVDDGAQTQDMIKALRGILQEGFDFECSSSRSNDDHGYRNNPSREDQIYCLVIVIAGNTAKLMEPEVVNKMETIRKAAARLHMPQVIIMTKPDLTCPLVQKDLRKIYFSKKIKEKMQECSNLVGVTVNHIFPVKNYHEEMDTDDDMDALILKALDQIVNIACDELERSSQTKTPKSGDKPN